MVALPFAGGSAWSYQPLQALVPALSALDYPGHGRRLREPLSHSLESLALDVVSQLRGCVDPFVLMGHSLGAQVAAYAAAPLLQAGAPVRGVVVSGSEPIWHSEPDADPAYLWDDDSFAQEVAKHELNPGALSHPELRALALPILRHDYALASTLPPTPPTAVDVPVLAMGGEDDEELDRERLAKWSTLAEGRFEQKLFGGGHFFLLQTAMRDVATRLLEFAASV